MTEDELKNTLCHKTLKVTPVRGGGYSTGGTECIGSACSAFRKIVFVQILTVFIDTGKVASGFYDPETQEQRTVKSEGHSYCGLAGKPS